MVVSELVAKGMTLIEGKEYSNSRLESILVLAHLLSVDKNYIYIHGDNNVEPSIENEFINIMEKRAEGFPLQYLLNEEEFMGLKFYVEEGVLIPRPDTEVLVQFIIDYIKKQEMNVLDIGIGSGAISLSIAEYCPSTRVYGIDIEEIPMKVANINKEKLKISNANFYKGDLFKALEDQNIDEKFHVIVSNPPYIKTSDIDDLQVEVKDHEPWIALDGGEDGLDFYRKISKDALKYLVDEGMLIYEIGYDQGAQVMDVLNKEGFQNISILKDYQGNDRVVYGFKG